MTKNNSHGWLCATIGSGGLLSILAIIILADGYFYWYYDDVIAPLALISLITFIISLGVMIANEFSSIAEEKGYAGKKYFWYTFLIPVVGILMVIALPDHNKA